MWPVGTQCEWGSEPPEKSPSGNLAPNLLQHSRGGHLEETSEWGGIGKCLIEQLK